MLFSVDNQAGIATIIRIYNVIISSLNITGNSLLIWGLSKTGQTKTISFQFIILMSISDMISGISSLVLLTLLTWEQFHAECWLKLSTQVILKTCNLFSIFMVVLIALDRYLHMKYLERYFLVFNKRRGHFLVIASFIFAMTLTSIFALPLPLSPTLYATLKLVYFFLTFPVVLTIIILYYCAVREVRMNENQITRSVLIQNRTLTNAAKRITICIAILSVPAIITGIVEWQNNGHNLTNTLIAVRWFSYLTHLVNGFCSSLIFISQNRPIRQLLRRFPVKYCDCMRSEVCAMEPNT